MGRTRLARGIRWGAALVLQLILLLSAGSRALATDWRAIPLHPEQAYADTSDLAALCDKLYQVVWPKTLESPERFTCRAGLYGGDLIILATTNRPVSDKPVKTCPYLERDSFGVMLDMARNLSGFHVLVADFSGKAKLFQCQAAGYWIESRVKVVTTVSTNEGKTAVLARVPLKEIGVAPGQGDVWGVFCMRWGLDDKGEAMLCVGNRPVTNLSRSLHYVPTPRHFEPWVIGSAEDGISLTRGNLARDEVFAANRFTWTYLKPQETGEALLKIVFRRAPASPEQAVKTVAFRCRAGEPAVVNVPYTCPDDAGSMTFLVERGGQTLYRSTYPVLGNPAPALAVRKGGFDDGRVEKRPDPRLKDGRILTWPQSLDGHWMVEQNAIPAAFVYDYEGWLKYLKDSSQITILEHPGFWGRDEFAIHAPAFRRHHLKCAVMPTATRADAPFKDEKYMQFLPDPKVRQAWLNALVDALTKYPDVVAYVSVGDELTESLIDASLALWAKRKEEYPLIREINADVEKRFGAGRYGIPAGFNDDGFKWLAFRRWVADFQEQFFREVAAKARGIKPDVMFISPDPQYGSRAQYFEGWRGMFEIATHQAAPAESSPFDCKVLKDLAGAPHVWPCPHLPSYGKAYAPNEIRDILSECFMAGADGLHFWPVAERDNFVRPFEIDAPGATRMLMQFGEMTATGLKPKHGQAQVGVLYANDSYCARGWPEPYQVRTAYEGLGPGLGVEFKLVGDLGLERGHDRLEDFKVCVVPWAEIERRPVVEKLLAAVKNGLFLVVHHPGAFSRDVDGSKTDEWAGQFLGGARLVPAQAAAPRNKVPNVMRTADCDFMHGLKEGFTYKGEPATFADLPAGAQVIMRYPDENKTAAAVLVPMGKGSVIWMGAEMGVYSSCYATLYRHICTRLGIPVDQPGWRITLPLDYRRTAAEGLYYTGNYYGLEFSIPQIASNVYLPGTYRYSLPPDAKGAWSSDPKAPKDIGNPEKIPFAEGSLTDRPRDARNGVKYTRADAFHIDFDLTAHLPLRQVDVYAAGYVPDIQLSISDDGQTFEPVAKQTGPGEVSGVVCCSLAPGEGQTKTARHLRLGFGTRPERKDLVLAEVDIVGPDHVRAGKE